MWTYLQGISRRLTLAQRFLLASLVILVTGMLGVGWWVSQQIEAGVVHRTAATTALYVDSFVAPHLQELAIQDAPSAEQVAMIDQLLRDTTFGQQIASFKVWNAQGRILYSTKADNLDRVFPVQGGLASAWQGQVAARISDLQDAENELERQTQSQLLEIYSPVRLRGTNRIIAVAEFYQIADDLAGELSTARRQSWLLVGGATLLMYLLLAIFIRRISQTITRQQNELSHQVVRLTEVLDQNDELHERVRRAAARTTALNERFLRRISAELHDGPAQDLGLALLRLDNVTARAEALQSSQGEGSADRAELELVTRSVNHAMEEVRAISTGMGLPQLQDLTVTETLNRAIRAHERRTSTEVEQRTEGLPDQAPLSVKITLYRVVQEALNNAFRHAAGVGQRVDVSRSNERLLIQVSDEGPGLNGAQEADWNEHMGLVGMRERVESLGGIFRIESKTGCGTRVIAELPLQRWGQWGSSNG